MLATLFSVGHASHGLTTNLTYLRFSEPCLVVIHTSMVWDQPIAHGIANVLFVGCNVQMRWVEARFDVAAVTDLEFPVPVISKIEPRNDPMHLCNKLPTVMIKKQVTIPTRVSLALRPNPTICYGINDTILEDAFQQSLAVVRWPLPGATLHQIISVPPKDSNA